MSTLKVLVCHARRFPVYDLRAQAPAGIQWFSGFSGPEAVSQLIAEKGDERRSFIC